MTFYKNREAYVRTFCTDHYQVKHHHPISAGEKRESFFRINDEEEMLAACVNWAHFPCVVQVGLTGGFVNRKDSIRQRNTNTIMFLSKMLVDEFEPIEATAITNAYDESYGVMSDFISMMNNDFEENGGCGVFQNFDPALLHWEQVGPIGDGLYGWILSWSDETTASAILNYDPAHFPGPPVAITEDEIRFVSEEGNSNFNISD